MFPTKLLKGTGIDGSEIAHKPVLGLTSDSRAVLPGYLFAALDGSQARGKDFVEDAIARGARMVIAGEAMTEQGAAIIAHENPRYALAICARNFFEFAPSCMAAVTGTNGKTSVATLVRQLWELNHRPAASIGTLGVESDKIYLPLQHTTPEPVQLHAILRDLTFLDIEHCILEASSHGLDQRRLDGADVNIAAFTNLTHDHLDYHGDYETYFLAKARLFTDVLISEGVAVIDVGSEAGARVAELTRARGIRLITTGKLDADIYIKPLALYPHGQDIEIHYEGHISKIFLPLVGSFQCQNLAVALGIVSASGFNIGELLKSLSFLSTPRGRMEYAGVTHLGAHVYVDYAHTPDALERSLATLKATGSEALWVVFGCGGDRDQTKRIEMGAVAQSIADHIVVTDDNPRFEDAASIRKMVIAGCVGAEEIPDRAAAIARALDQAKAGNIILVAGKGHEGGQTINGKTLPFDDVACIKAHILTTISKVGGRDA